MLKDSQSGGCPCVFWVLADAKTRGMATSATEVRSGMETFRSKSQELSEIASILNEEVGRFKLKAVEAEPISEAIEVSEEQEEEEFVLEE